MQRRKLLAGMATGMAITAGCTGESESDGLSGDLNNDIDNLKITNKETKEEENSVGKILSLRATVENTGENKIEFTTEGSFYDSNGAKLETNLIDEYSGPAEVPPGETISGDLASTPDVEEAAEYDISIVSDSNQTPTPTETSTPEDEETPEETETPEPVEASFSDDWEDGDYMSDPTWLTNITYSGNQSTAAIEVIDETPPSGGSNAVELYAESGSEARLLTEDRFRWDTSWELNGLVKIKDKHSFSAGFKIGIATTDEDDFYWEPSLRWDIDDNGQDTAYLDDLNGSGITQPWETDVWYHYKISHDGDNIYRLKIWEEGTEEPDWQSQATGSPPDTSEENKAGIGLSARQVTVQHAYISYETTN